MTNGSTEWTYTYNSDGLRTKRTNGTTTYNYVYTGDKLTQLTVGNNTLVFNYDASGTPMTVTMNGETFYYVTNLQGDVVALLDSDGDKVGSYRYTAYGTVHITMGHAVTVYNPLLYRGYVFDLETGLYYVSSRYYDPEIGRFINADVYTSTGQGLLGNNMFAYCNNNPVNNVDPLGLWTISISGALSGVFGLGISLSLGFAFDDQRNFDLQYSYAIPGVDDTVMVGGIGIGGGIAVQYTKADTVYDLYGPATYVGASAGPGWYVGGDVVSFSDASDPEMTTDGFQLYAGYGGVLDAHIIESYTRSWSNTTISTQSSFSRGSLNRAIYATMIH